MENLRNFISQFRKPGNYFLNGPEDISSNNILPNNDIEDNIKNQNNILQRNDDKEASLTEEINIPQSNDIKEFSINETNVCKDITIVKIKKKVETKACQYINKNVCEANKVKNPKKYDKITAELLNQLQKNTIPSIKTKVESTDSQCMNLNRQEIKIEDNIELIQNETNNRQPSEAIFPDLPKVLEATNSKLPNNTNVTFIRNESNENRNSNPFDSINSNDSHKIQYVNDKTTKCLQEFDKVLSEVQRKDNSVGVESLSLEGNDDIILDERLGDNDYILNIDDIFDDEDLDMDNTYNLQEIKHNSSNIDQNDLIAIGHNIIQLVTGTREIKDLKSETEDNIDIISISSDDDTSTILENNSTDILVETIKKLGKEISVIKHNEYCLIENNAGNKRFAKTMTNERTKSTRNSERFENKKSEDSQIPDTKSSEKNKSSEAIIIVASSSGHNYIRKKSSVANIFKETDSTEETKSFEDAKSKKKKKLHKGAKSTISIQSDKIESDDCGYHTSDFECISEDEANKVGLFSKFDLDIPFNSTDKTKEPNSHGTMQFDPYGPGPSRNSGSYSHRAKDKETSEESSEENYVMPQESEMVNMFRDMPPIPRSEIHFMENKSLHARAPMMVQYEGIGFELSVALHQDTENEEYRDDARENMKKILEMYPDENSTRKRSKKPRR